MRSIFILLSLVFSLESFAQIPVLDLTSLPGSYQCKVGDRESMAKFQIKIENELFIFKFDQSKTIYSYSLKALQEDFNKAQYKPNDWNTSTFSSKNEYEEKINGKIHYLYYQLFYNKPLKMPMLSEFTVASGNNQIDCVMVNPIH